MRKIAVSIAALALAAGLSGALAACSQKTQDSAAADVRNAAGDVKDAASEVVNSDEVKDLGSDIKAGAKDAAAEVKAAASDAGDKLEAAGSELKAGTKDAAAKADANLDEHRAEAKKN